MVKPLSVLAGGWPADAARFVAALAAGRLAWHESGAWAALQARHPAEKCAL